ncbi:MAG: QueT transporter family protein [Candidatus Bathyarchaeia archaeon]|nr:QueT transporter family protein [Candidatus Bathyarchaeota archaeon]
MKFESKDVVLTAVFAALYAAAVVFLAPISFEVFQVRVADALLPFAAVLGLPVAFGTSLGCFIANFYSSLGIVDVAGGAIANFIACILAWHIGGKSVFRRFSSCLAETVIVTLIVGSYLAVLLSMPIEVGLLGVFIGSVIAIDILGFSLLEALYRSGVAQKIVKR